MARRAVLLQIRHFALQHRNFRECWAFQRARRHPQPNPIDPPDGRISITAIDFEPAPGLVWLVTEPEPTGEGTDQQATQSDLGP